MTQEELDSLMNSDLSEAGDELENLQEQDEIEETVEFDSKNYRVSADSQWPPPPPTKDHKVVHQLDEVTQDSEQKAGEIFDILEQISVVSEEIEASGNSIRDEIEATRKVFEKLSSAFPNIETFKREVERAAKIQEHLNDIEEKTQGINDSTMMAMDVMQYQDIHRQKIERVINVMRALSKYMNQLFEGQISDEKRVGSAVHLHGDDTADLVDEEDIEALISSFGKK